MVAPPRPGTVRSAKQGRDFGAGQEVHHSTRVSFARDREDSASGLGEVRSQQIAQVVNEREDGGQASVATTSGVSPLGFEVRQERMHAVDIQRGQRQYRGSGTARPAKEAQKEAKGVAIGGDGVGAEVSLADEVFRQEARQELAQIGCLHVAGIVKFLAACLRSPGVDVRYQ